MGITEEERAGGGNRAFEKKKKQTKHGGTVAHRGGGKAKEGVAKRFTKSNNFSIITWNGRCKHC